MKEHALWLSMLLAPVTFLGCGTTADGEGVAEIEQASHLTTCPPPTPGMDAGMMEEPPTSIPVAPITFDAVYVVNGGDGMDSSISVINAETNTLARTIVLSGAMWAHHIYRSPHGLMGG